MAKSRSNMDNKDNKCIPSGAQTHMMTNTKLEPRARQRNLFLCAESIL